jgi:XTP/dITP diphosphohydrolase
MELVVATKNKKKLKEIEELLANTNIKISSLAHFPDAPSINEDGKTFLQNAIKKATTIAQFTKKPTLGEDSGLEVKALNNKPGVYSSRFSGPGATDRKNNLKLLRLLKNVPLKKREARYICAVALSDKNGLIFTGDGRCSGVIGFKSKGTYGFGYDPLFVIPKYNKTFAELGPKIKHTMSHRAEALKKLKKFILGYLQKSL